MKKRVILLFIILLIGGSVVAWLLLGSATGFKDDRQYLFVYEGKPVKEQVMRQIEEKKLVRFPALFNLLANQAGVWKKLKPGRFEFKQGDNIITIIRMLRNNQQTAVKMVIHKLRTREDFAKLIHKQFNIDSAAVFSYVSDNDSLAKWHVDTATFFTLIVPDTYEMYWTPHINKVIDKLNKENEKFWNSERRAQLSKLDISKEHAYTLASIVEEETNNNEEKGKIASVYLNRFHKGMAMGADPTVKYALRDFGLKRILYGHLEVQSPYNTYKNKGFPPGPICTPSKRTIDEVLKAPSTDYLYFVASKAFDGTHVFNKDYKQHLLYAKEYQQQLDVYMKEKQNGK
jgi:UPF0755 protein